MEDQPSGFCFFTLTFVSQSQDGPRNSRHHHCISGRKNRGELKMKDSKAGWTVSCSTRATSWPSLLLASPNSPGYRQVSGVAYEPAVQVGGPGKGFLLCFLHSTRCSMSIVLYLSASFLYWWRYLPYFSLCMISFGLGRFPSRWGIICLVFVGDWLGMSANVLPCHLGISLDSDVVTVLAWYRNRSPGGKPDSDSLRNDLGL